MLDATKRNLLPLVRTAWLVALVFSVALYVHYVDPANSGFCSGRSGCEAVRRSGYAYFFGLTWFNLPLVGAACFVAALGLSLLPLPRESRPVVVGGAAALGGVVGIALVAVQWFQIEASCWLCMVVDGSAIVAGLLGALWIGLRGEVQREPFRLWAWWSILVLSALSPVGLWFWQPSPPVPDGVARLYEPGKINVVEFADFECPYCRTMHGIFNRLNREYGDRVNFHQLHFPLPGHPHAMRAAAAAVCAENAGHGEAMKHRLFTHPLNDEAPVSHAKALGLDVAEFETCIDSAATLRRIEADKAILMNANFRGLPTTFVGAQRVVGWRVYPAMKEAYELASAKDGGRGLEIPRWLFVAIVGSALAGIGVLGRIRGNGLAEA